MNNILITGANGQLGSELQEIAKDDSCNYFFTDTDNLDITNFATVEEFIETNNISTIINCAAYTAVDKAEDEKEIANKINNLAVENLAIISKKFDIKFIHISTDYVFDGKNHKPYTETDQTNPVNTYGKTKLAGENAILQQKLKNSVIIRTSWVYSSFGNNFVKTMLRLGEEKQELNIIFDQIGAPTYARDLAQTILKILPDIKNSNTDIYNYNNEGVCSWYDFAKEIVDIAKINCKINPIESKDYKTLAKRPYYSVLNKAKIKQEFAIKIPHWQSSLQECIKKIKRKDDV
jgi:dTDP-4-dehydrorhamnose reductase